MNGIFRPNINLHIVIQILRHFYSMYVSNQRTERIPVSSSFGEMRERSLKPKATTFTNCTRIPVWTDRWGVRPPYQNPYPNGLLMTKTCDFLLPFYDAVI